MITEKLADEVYDIVDHDTELPEEKTIEVLEALLDEMMPCRAVVDAISYNYSC